MGCIGIDLQQAIQWAQRISEIALIFFNFCPKRQLKAV